MASEMAAARAVVLAARSTSVVQRHRGCAAALLAADVDGASDSALAEALFEAVKDDELKCPGSAHAVLHEAWYEIEKVVL